MPLVQLDYDIARPPRRLFVVLLLSVLMSAPTMPETLRLVPQVNLTSMRPGIVLFHPSNPSVIMVHHVNGRIDMVEINDTAKPNKLAEIPGTIVSAHLSTNGKTIVSGDRSGRVILWDAERGTRIDSLSGHVGPVTTVAINSVGTRAASGGVDGKVRMWDIDSPSVVLKTGTGHDGIVTSVAYSQDGSKLVSGGVDGAVNLWDTTRGTLIHTFLSAHSGGVTHVEFSRTKEDVFVSGGKDGKIHIWSQSDKKQIESVNTGHVELAAIALSPDGTSVVSGGMSFPADVGYIDFISLMLRSFFDPERPSIELSNTLRFWNIDTGESIRHPMNQYGAAVMSVAFSPKGTRVLSAGSDGLLRLWDVEGAEFYQALSVGRGAVSSIDFSRDGVRMVAGDENGMLKTWNLGELKDQKHIENAHNFGISTVSIAPDDRTIISVGPAYGLDQLRGDFSNTDNRTSEFLLWRFPQNELVSEPILKLPALLVDGGVSLVSRDNLTTWIDYRGQLQTWDLNTGTQVNPAERSYQWLAVAVNANGDRVLTRSGGHWQLREVNTGKTIGESFRADDGATSIALSADGMYLATGSSNGSIRLRDIRGGGERILRSHEDRVSSIAFGPRGLHFASGGEHGTLRLWNIEGQRPIGNRLRGHTRRVSALTFSDDGRYLASGDGGGNIRLWRLGHPTRVADAIRGSETSIPSVGFHMDRDGISTVSGRGVGRTWVFQADVTSVSLWTVSTPVRVAGFSGNGNRAILISDDGTIGRWDSRNADSLVDVPRDGTQIVEVGLTEIGVRFIGKRTDGSLSMGDLGTQSSVEKTFEIDPNGSNAIKFAFSKRGDRFVSGHEDGSVNVWHVSDSGAVEHFAKLGTAGAKVTALAFSPDGRKIVSAKDDGTVGIRVIEYSVDSALEATCISSHLQWISSRVVVSKCSDRVVVFDDELKKRGEIFLRPDGIIIIVDGRGVYSHPSSLGDHVSKYMGSKYEGVADRLVVGEIRKYLLDEVTIAAIDITKLARVVEVIARGVGGVFASFDGIGKIVPGVGSGIAIWVFFVLASIGLWLMMPVRFAWFAMWRSDRRQGRGESAGMLSKIGAFVGVWSVLGQSGRSLTKWLQKYRKRLELECFVENRAVKHHHKFCVIGKSYVDAFNEAMESGGRGLLWISGRGGSGKTALAIHLVRKAVVGQKKKPVPVFVGEDWEGPLVKKIGRSLKAGKWTIGPTEEMVRIMGSKGWILPVVDSLSERRMQDAVSIVGDGIADRDFQNLIVTSRDGLPEGERWDSVQEVHPPVMECADVHRFIQEYAGETRVVDVKGEIEAFLKGRRVPSPLFLRFAIEEALDGPIGSRDRRMLVVRHVERLCENKMNIKLYDMKRAGATAAMAAIQDQLSAQEFTEDRLRSLLKMEEHDMPFNCEEEGHPITVSAVVDMLVESGLIIQGDESFQFTYDAVAEYLVLWRLDDAKGRRFEGLRERVLRSEGTEIGEAYREIIGSK